MTDEKPSTLPLLAAGCTLLLWASAFVAIRYLGDDFSAGPLSLGRLLVGAAVLTVFATRQPLPKPTLGQWRSIALIGVLWFGLYNVALNEGETRVDAGTAAMLIQFAPVLVAVGAAVFLSEPFTRNIAAGLAIAFAGVVVISLSTSEGSDRDLIGVGLCLVSAVAYAISLILQKPLVAQIEPVHITWLACTVGAISCLPFAPAMVSELAAAPASSVAWLVYLGIFPTAIAFTTYAFALRYMSAGSLSVTTYLVPPITIVMAWALLAETPPVLAYLGGALALIGVSLARRKPRPTRTAEPAAA